MAAATVSPVSGVTNERGSKSGTALVATLVGILSIFDALIIGLPTLALAAWFNPLIVFVVVGVIVTVINIVACNWVDRKWEAWIVGSRFETKMQQIRSVKRARHPIEWINRGSAVWFGLAAALLNAIQVVALNRLITGRPAGERRIVVASLTYSVFVAGIFSLLGYALREAIRAL
jgi:hypothetical protein